MPSPILVYSRLSNRCTDQWNLESKLRTILNVSVTELGPYIDASKFYAAMRSFGFALSRRSQDLLLLGGETINGSDIDTSITTAITWRALR